MAGEIVTFRNVEGEALFGIIQSPTDDKPAGIRKGVILPNTGIHYRVAWHRLNVELSARLARNGFHVMRFDPHGIGDSEGELDESQDMIRQFDIIQQGLFARDAIRAVDVFQQKYTLDRIYLAGFCGGALTSLIAAGADPRVNGVIYVAGPVTIDSEFEASLLHPVYAKELFSSYLKKALNPSSWYRLVTGKSDYRLIRQTLATTVNEKNIRREIIGEDVEGSKEGGSFNWKFLESFKACTSRGAGILFVMAEVDPARYGFDNYFRKRYLSDGNPYQGKFEYHVVKGANHTFSTRDSRSDLFGTIEAWLERH
jgi:pimeloyl-ACP methyl ester carboxylesterase